MEFGTPENIDYVIAIGDTTPPAAITDLITSKPTIESITLTWTAPGDDENTGSATGYVVKYSTSGSITDSNWNSAITYTQSWTPLDTGNTETHVVSGLNSNTQYWFAIKAYDEVPNYGAISNSPSGKTLATQTPIVETQSATNVAEAEATLNGMIINDGGSSIIERRFDWGTTPSCSDGWTNDVAVSGNSFSYRLTGLQPSTTYYFRAWAKNSAGWSEGNVLSFTTYTLITEPSPPRNLIATLGVGEIDLSWDPPLSDGGSPITNYKIYRGTSPNGEILYYTTTTTDTTFRNIANLEDGVTYYYKVTTVNSIGESDFSNEAFSTFTLNNPPYTPSTPSGPSSGYIGTFYSYSTSTTDPDGNQVKYTFDWGDGTQSKTDFVNSGTDASISHSWSGTGTYYVKTKATDSKGASSGWSSLKTVTLGEATPLVAITNLEIWHSWSKTFKVGKIDNELKISLIRSAEKNNEILANWQVIPDESYNFLAGVLIEISNFGETLDYLGTSQFVKDFCDILLSQDGDLRIFISVNTITTISNWSFDKRTTIFIEVLTQLIELFGSPKNPISLPASFRCLIESPILSQICDTVRGTNQYELKIEFRKNPILAIFKILDIFGRIDFYILSMNSNNVVPVRISSHDLINTGSFALDILKLAIKMLGINLVQAGTTAYKIFYQIIFDPPNIVEVILNKMFPDYLAKIQTIFLKFKGIFRLAYVAASFLDPPTARLDLGVFDKNESILLGYDESIGHTICSSDIGFVVGDENGQFMFLNFSVIQALNFSVMNTDLDGNLDSPLNFTLTIKRINSNETWNGGGYLFDGEKTSTIISFTNNRFEIPTLKCRIIENVYPNIKFQVLDVNGYPLEIDSLDLYLNYTLLTINSKYLGNGTYIIENIPIFYNENDSFSLVVKKNFYLMSLTEISLTPPNGDGEEVPVILGYPIEWTIIMLLGSIGIGFILENINKKEKNKIFKKSLSKKIQT